MIAGLEKRQQGAAERRHARSCGHHAFALLQTAHHVTEQIGIGIAIARVHIARLVVPEHRQSFVSVLVFKIGGLIDRHHVRPNLAEIQTMGRENSPRAGLDVF